MNDAQFFPLAVQSTLDVHQTTSVAHHERGGLCGFKILYFTFQHLRRKFRMFDGKNSTKTAAVFSFG
jgi:hypothetical protein